MKALPEVSKLRGGTGGGAKAEREVRIGWGL